MVRASLDNSFPPGFKTVTAGFFSDSTEDKVWSGTMTVGTATDCPDALGWSSSSFRTCRDSGDTNFEGDALTRRGFVYDDEKYQFHSVEFNTGRKELSVLFGNKKENGFMEDDALRGAMTIQVGGMEFPLVDAIYPGHAIYQVIGPRTLLSGLGKRRLQLDRRRNRRVADEDAAASRGTPEPDLHGGHTAYRRRHGHAGLG